MSRSGYSVHDILGLPEFAEPLTLPDMDRSWERESFAEVASRLWGGA